MKTINKIFSLLLLFTVAVISGCSRDYDAPPLNEPLYEGDEANITINELKEKYKEVLQGDAKQIDFDFILKARIISSDDEGNVYKQMYVQDATSGLNIQIDQSNISKVYPLGQEVYLQIKGLYMGSYNGVMQLAAAPLDPEKPNNTSRISFEKFKTLAFKDKWPAPDKVTPTVTSISDLKDEMVCTLITLKDVSFVGGGELSYAEVGNDAPNASDRTLKDKKGSSITVRTSKYATFAADVLPSGTGEVTAILGKFRDTWQLTINSVKDVKSFDGEEPSNPNPEPEPGEEANTTIADFIAKYSGATESDPIHIDEDIKIGGIVTSDNNPGNIFSKFYIQDKTGAITIVADNNVINDKLKAGFEVVINARGLDAVVYAKVLEVGYKDGYNNRIPKEKFDQFVKLKSTDIALVQPKVISISDIKDSDLKTLIQLDGVSFEDAGLPFVNSGDKNTNRNIIDAQGNKIILRTSDHANFKDEKLPAGKGTVLALLDRHLDSWQLFLRDINDVKNFDGTTPDPIEPEQPTGDFYYKETFGTKEYANKERPFIKDFKDSDNEGKVILSDQYGTVNIRTYDKNSHAFFGGNKNGELAISKIDLSKGKGKKLVLSYKMAASLYLSKEDKESGKDLIANLNAITVSCNGKELPVPSKEVSFKNGDDNKFYTIEIDAEIPAEKDVTLVFTSLAEKNKTGFRIDDITISEKK